MNQKYKDEWENNIKIVKMYLDNHNTQAIADELKIGKTTVWNVLDYHRIPKRGPNDLRETPMKEDFFEKIDTEQKAYFLGWMYADGCVSQDLKCSQLLLRQKDLEIIEKLNNLIYFEPHYYFYKKDVVLRICRKKMNMDLVKLGCVPNKTFLIDFPTHEQVPERLQNHFIRGVFDGDGSIGPMTSGAFFANIVSTEKFCNKLWEILKNFNPKMLCKFDHINDKGTVVIRFTGINPIRFGQYLYQNQTISLKRKFDKYETLITMQKNKIYTNNNKIWMQERSRDVTEIVTNYKTISQ